MKKIKHVVGCTILFLLLLVTSVSAKQTGSVTEHLPVPGIKFSLYKVGEYIQEEGREYELTKKFADYNVDLTDVSQVDTLADYVLRDKITPDYTGETDENGDIYFENLEEAAYLMIGYEKQQGKTIYTPFPVLFSVPQWGENEELIYDIEIFGKHDFTKTERPEYGNVKVKKIWKDDGDPTNRPEDITVQLLKDGEPDPEIEDSEVILNEENNWSYIWERLDNRYEWTVLEKEVPPGYKLKIDTTIKDSKTDENLDHMNVVMTNTKTSHTPPPTDLNPPPPTTIVQTGQLWWPVGILAAAGLFFILIGLILIGRKEQN